MQREIIHNHIDIILINYKYYIAIFLFISVIYFFTFYLLMFYIINF